MLALRCVQAGGIYRAEYERLLRNNGGRKVPALVAISRKALRLMFRIARERRAYVPSVAPVAAQAPAPMPASEGDGLRRTGSRQGSRAASAAACITCKTSCKTAGRPEIGARRKLEAVRKRSARTGFPVQIGSPAAAVRSSLRGRGFEGRARRAVDRCGASEVMKVSSYADPGLPAPPLFDN
jgi:hypothetical protein